jgi:hypothetical protein
LLRPLTSSRVAATVCPTEIMPPRRRRAGVQLSMVGGLAGAATGTTAPR